MSLENQIKEILDTLDGASSEKIIELTQQIIPEFRSELTKEYLEEKIQKILNITDDVEKKKQCKALTPYFDWYLQGL